MMSAPQVHRHAVNTFGKKKDIDVSSCLFKFFRPMFFQVFFFALSAGCFNKSSIHWMLSESDEYLYMQTFDSSILLFCTGKKDIFLLLSFSEMFN